MAYPHRFKPQHVAAIIAILLFGLTFLPQATEARQILDIYGNNGHPLFRFDILDKGERAFDEDGDLAGESSWTVGAPELNAIREGSRYWDGILTRNVRNRGLIPFLVDTNDEFNASAGSPPLEEGPFEGMTGLAAALVHGWVDEKTPWIGTITLGSLFTKGAWTGPMDVLTKNGARPHVSATLGHELAHALGMLSNTEYDATLDQNSFASTLSTWDTFLRDSYGSPANPDMDISQGPGWSPGTFTIDETTAGFAFFRGPAALTALGNAVHDNANLLQLGLPINGFEGDYLEDGSIYSKSELSHVELKNVMMSHQNWRNYAVLTEAELAVYKDLGFDIDLKSQFGLSVYESNNHDIVNTTGFYARNANGTDWLPGVYNTSIGAMGLHIYGANNSVTQAADILSAGPGSAGIRMDGTYAHNQTPLDPTPSWKATYGDNRLVIAPGVKVHAMGQDSNGVLVAYGKNHQLVSRGEIAALGEGGVGVRFDFGDNLLGNDIEYRGSWMWTKEGLNQDPDNFELQGLDGSLVSRFDVTGTIAGKAAAIYIAENALVDQINIMAGARIYGDIISRWNPDDPRVQVPFDDNDTTSLTFGYKANSDGTPTFGPDPDFSMLYRGNIIGRKGIEVELKGGTLTWQGRMDVSEYDQEEGTTLTTIIGLNPSVISADSIEIEPGALLGVASDSHFQYGRTLHSGPLAVLSFDPRYNYVQGAGVINSTGSFAWGPYDYTWSNPRFLDARTVGVDVSRRYNRERGASSAITAPLALVTHNPASSAIMRRGVEVFNRNAAGTGSAASLLTAWTHNEAGAMLAASPKLALGQRNGYASNAGERKDRRTQSQQWIATASGGAQRGSSTSSLWVSPNYGYSGRSGGSGYDIRSVGMNMGYDMWFTDKAFAGLALTLDFPDYESDHADIDARSTIGTLYGGAKLPLELELGLFASYGRTRYEQKRRVYGEKYDSDYWSNIISLGANLGRSFAVSDNLAIRPFAAYEYTRLEVDNYSEGSGTYALSINRSNYDLHRIQAGSDIGWTFDNGAWISGRAWYEGLQGDRTATTPAYFVMDPGANTFTGRGDSMDRHSLGLGAGAGIPVNDWLSLTAGYTFLAGEKTTSHRVEAAIRFEF